MCLDWTTIDWTGLHQSSDEQPVKPLEQVYPKPESEDEKKERLWQAVIAAAQS